MQRGATAGARGTPPGIFETIAAAMSTLVAQPLPLVLPLAVDLYLWLGARLSPAALFEPLGRFLMTQDAPEAAELAGGFDRLGRTGDLVAIVGWFVPSLLAGFDHAEFPVPWPRPSLDPGNAAVVVALGVALLLVGVLGAMTLGVMLARLVRGAAPVDRRLARDAVVAALRYLAFLALATLVITIVAVPAGVVGAILGLMGFNVLPLIGLVLALAVAVAAIALAFVGEAIVVAEVGPLRAMSLSLGVVRRNPWTTLGLLLVLWIVLFTVPDLAERLTTTALGVALAIAAYAFVATGLALARVQFFYDRLRRWRADLIPPLHPAT